jgi:hypothetical protein
VLQAVFLGPSKSKKVRIPLQPELPIPITPTSTTRVCLCLRTALWRSLARTWHLFDRPSRPQVSKNTWNYRNQESRNRCQTLHLHLDPRERARLTHLPYLPLARTRIRQITRLVSPHLLAESSPIRKACLRHFTLPHNLKSTRTQPIVKKLLQRVSFLEICKASLRTLLLHHHLS